MTVKTQYSTEIYKRITKLYRKVGSLTRLEHTGGWVVMHNVFNVRLQLKYNQIILKLTIPLLQCSTP